MIAWALACTLFSHLLLLPFPPPSPSLTKWFSFLLKQFILEAAKGLSGSAYVQTSCAWRFGGKKMNESNNTGAAERGWGERGRDPAQRFWLQARVEVRSRQPAPSEGGTEKGQRGWGETFRLPPAMCNGIAANPELLVFQMALGGAPLPA